MIRSFKELRKTLDPDESLVLTGGFLLVALLEGVGGPRPFDDAFITFRYARNISRGHGFVYNVGQRVLGTTTPLYTLILAVSAWVTSPETLPWASLVLAIAADAVSVWLAFRLTRWVFSDRVVATIVSGAFLFQPLRLNVSTGGMETSIFLMCILAMYERYLVGNRSLSTAVWAALALLVRPDAALALIPLFLHWSSRNWRQALVASSLSLVLVAPWAIWATSYFGDPVPLSITAKRLAYDNPPGHAAFFLLTFLSTGTVGPYEWLLRWVPGILIALFLVVTGLWALAKERRAALVIAIYPLLYAGVMCWANPAMYFAWYFVPLIPGLILLATAAVWYMVPTSCNVRRLAIGALAALVTGLSTLLINASPTWPLSRAREAKFWDACAVLNKSVQPSDWILAPDIGVVGWCLEANVLDPIGLVSPEALAYLEDRADGQLVAVELVLDKRPEYVVALHQFLHPYLLDSPAFRESYHVIWQDSVKIADQAQPMYIFVRDDKPRGSSQE